MYKSKLQELCQKKGWNLPEYTAVRDGPDHNPRFTATVVVNGSPFETPKSQCRSSKEAQNLAAQLALHHLTASDPDPLRLPLPEYNFPPSLSIASPSSPAHLSGSSFSSSHAGTRLTTFGSLQPKQENNAPASGVNGIPFGCEDDKRPKDMLHMYKNRLQHYAQKLSLNLPSYSCEFEGPPHARHFKSKVTVGDKTYETSEFFPTLKDAEHAAAKVAFESLSHHEIQEDEGLYKSLLQQFTQKEGLLFPTYTTTKSGPPHTPIFVSTVEIGADVFHGQEAKTRKQAEMRAAQVAYNALIERRARESSPVYKVNGASEFTSSNLRPVQSVIGNHLWQEITNADPVNVEGPDHNKECNLKETLEISSSSIRSVFPADFQQNIQPKAEIIVNQEVNDVQDAKRYRCSSSSAEVNGHLKGPFPPSTSSMLDLASKSTNLKNPICPPNGSENQKASAKIIVYPRHSELAIPDGASVLPFSDDKWVAVEVSHQE